MNYLPRAQEVIDVEIDALRRTREALDGALDQATDLLLECLQARRKIVVTGVGKCLHVAEKISATLASTGSTSVVLNPTQAMHGDLGVLAEGDVLLALSFSGASDEILRVIPCVKRLGLRVITLTGVPDSPLAECSDVVLPIVIEKEACPFNMAPTASTTAMMAVGDALAMVLLDARGFGKEDYAKLHPGGSIGRALLLRVSEIMRTGERLPRVVADATVKEAVLAMTRARSGSCAVLDAGERVIGIFTDGDLRRHIADAQDVLSLRIAAVMTASPVTVRQDQLAVDVLQVFETHPVDDLLVVDDHGRLVGAIDIQDLPRFKVM